MEIKFKKVHSAAKTPFQATKGDAGYDLFAVESVYLNPFERKIIKTGIQIEIPEGYYGRIAPRSGLAIKAGIDVMAGILDSCYRGEVGVILINLNVLDFISEIMVGAANAITALFGFKFVGRFDINPGDRVAQLIIEKCHEVEWREVGKLSETDRGEGGFGSSGIQGSNV